MMAPLFLVSMATAAMSVPMPFPLPTNISFGKCGIYSNLIPNCMTRMALAPNISIRCSSSPGCTNACEASTLFQQVLQFGHSLLPFRRISNES